MESSLASRDALVPETVTAWLCGIDLIPVRSDRSPGLGDISGDLATLTSALDGAGFTGGGSEEITVSSEDSEATTTQFVVNTTCLNGRYAVVAVRGTVTTTRTDGWCRLPGAHRALSASYGFRDPWPFLDLQFMRWASYQLVSGVSAA